MEQPRSERELQKWLARKLGIPMVPPALWKELVDGAFVWEVLDAPIPRLFEDIEREARRRWRGWRLTGRTTRTGRREKSSRSLMTAAEIRRSEVFSRFLGRYATRDRAVIRFRSQVLGDRIPSTTEAERLLASPALYLLSPAELRSRSVPLLAHEADVHHRREHRTRERWKERITLKLRWARRSTTCKFSIPRRAHDAQWLEVPPLLWGRATPFNQVEPFVRLGSAFDQLRKASLWLSERFPWTPWDAVWFVLTNEPPFVYPVEVGIRSWTSQSEGVEAFHRSVLTLTVDPWVSSKSLERVFRAHQKELLGARNRGLRENTLDVFAFVLDREGSEGRSMSWPRLCNAWNRAHTNRRYSEYRHFRGDYFRAREALLLPKKRMIRPIRLL
jgi:hypothetical protein